MVRHDHECVYAHAGEALGKTLDLTLDDAPEAARIERFVNDRP